MSSPLPRYLFRRGSTLYLRLQPPGQRAIERSLGTSDVKAAELAADKLIYQHKQLMYARRLARLPRVTPFWDRAYEPGLHTIDGKQVFATERELRDLTTGAVIGPNGGPAEILIPAPRDGIPSFEAYDAAKARPTLPTKGSDDDLLETYIKHNGITGLREKQARDIWHIFKTVVNKPVAKCTRDDGRAIVEYLEKDGEVKSATLRRKLVPLVATVNLAIDEGKYSGINPFSSVVPIRDDEDERDPFTEDDMKLIRANLHLLDKNDQILVRLLATTGVRRGEAFEIDREETEHGIRFVTIGTKTPQSLRRIPFPTDLLPFLPEKITAQLIPGRMDSASKRLGAWLTKIGVINENDGRDLGPMHSFRHRAANRLRAAGVLEDVREAVGGWANGKKKKTSRKYGNKHGAGYPLSVLKEAIDKIGF
jgi:integrase